MSLVGKQSGGWKRSADVLGSADMDSSFCSRPIKHFPHITLKKNILRSPGRYIQLHIAFIHEQTGHREGMHVPQAPQLSHRRGVEPLSDDTIHMVSTHFHQDLEYRSCSPGESEASRAHDSLTCTLGSKVKSPKGVLVLSGVTGHL